jgi:gamma-glutamylcyclotransferase (GGCT)/AIG2-like uncharacterized protein YtfP
MENRYLFVYGTLREDAGHEMYHVLAKHAVFVGAATVRGELYSLGDYPGLVPRHDATGEITGEVYEIGNEALEQTLSILDDYEGLGPEDPLPHEYRRELVRVTLSDGRQLEAWAYVVNRSLEGLGRIHSGDFAEWSKSRGA